MVYCCRPNPMGWAYPIKMSKIYGIIGQSSETSLLLAMHRAAFEAEGMEAEVQYFDLDPVDHEALANFCYESDLNEIEGFSVVGEYKQLIMDYLDHYDPLSQQLGAANTVQNEASNLNGFNTEVTAILKALQEKTKLLGKKILILGAGELARAAIYGLKEFGAEIYIWNRTREKAEDLAEEFDVELIDFSEITEKGFDIFINTTPVGDIEHADQSLLTSDQIKEGAVVMDLILQPLETKLLQEAKKAGAMPSSGDRFLLHQATGQFEIWFNRPAPVEVMEKALMQGLPK